MFARPLRRRALAVMAASALAIAPITVASAAHATDDVVLDTLSNSVASGWGLTCAGGTGFGIDVPTATEVKTITVRFSGTGGENVRLDFFAYEPANSTAGNSPFSGLTPLGSLGYPTFDPATGIGVYTGSVTLSAGKYFMVFGGTGSLPPLLVARGINSATVTGTWTFASESPGTIRLNYCVMLNEPNATPLIRVGGLPAATGPGAPTDLSSKVGNKKLALHWTAPEEDGGSSITGYHVQFTTAGADASEEQWVDGWRDCSPEVTGMTAETSCDLTGLENGTQYWFRVAASNEDDTSEWSVVSAGATPVHPGLALGLAKNNPRSAEPANKPAKSESSSQGRPSENAKPEVSRGVARGR